ncbi:DUF3575 domain-containing protein [Chitinophaga defluvii]|uniref:Outer membrane protein with beta-barrel domain n=1 Tax=Chitinophaga defluvii TaxID=3163343 RepID=A0ABV2TGZ8_9BACT
MTKTLLLFILLSGGIINGAFAQQDTSKTALRDKGRKLTKGTWHVGATLSLKSRDFSNTDLVLVNIINFKQNAFVIRTEAGYFFKENLSAGLAVEYGQKLFDIKGNVYNDNDIKGYRDFSRSFAITPFIKNYIPMSANHTFFITNQTELQYLHREGTSENLKSDNLNRTYTTRNQYGIGIRPGIMVFFTKNLAFETNMGILGLYHSSEKATHTDKADSKRTETSVDFKFDLLKLGFGFSYYF